MNRANGILSPLFHLTALCSLTLCAIASVAVCNAGDHEKPPDAGRRKIIWGDPISVYRKPPLEVFGEKELPPVNSGFLFVDGEYLDLPYRITQRGQCVYVNGRRILKYIWPPNVFCIHREMPNIPKKISEKAHRIWDLKLDENTIHAYGFDPEYNLPSDYDSLISYWCYYFYTPRAAAGIYAEQLAKLPFIERTETLNKPAVGVRIYYTDGFSHEVQNVNPDFRHTITIYGHREIIEHMETSMKVLVGRLNNGEVIFWDSRDKSYWNPYNMISHLGARVGGMPRNDLPMKMPAVVRTIKSKDMTLKEKKHILSYKLHVYNPNCSIKRFLLHFYVDEEFRNRLRKMMPQN